MFAPICFASRSRKTEAKAAFRVASSAWPEQLRPESSIRYQNLQRSLTKTTVGFMLTQLTVALWHFQININHNCAALSWRIQLLSIRTNGCLCHSHAG